MRPRFDLFCTEKGIEIIPSTEEILSYVFDIGLPKTTNTIVVNGRAIPITFKKIISTPAICWGDGGCIKHFED